MINYIWFFIFIIGLLFGLVTGKGDVMSKIVSSSASSTVTLVIEIMGAMCLWCGVMNIAKESGLTDKLSIILRPVLKMLFKNEG